MSTEWAGGPNEGAGRQEDVFGGLQDGYEELGTGLGGFKE